MTRSKAFVCVGMGTNTEFQSEVISRNINEWLEENKGRVEIKGSCAVMEQRTMQVIVFYEISV